MKNATMVNVSLRLPWPECEPGIFWVFVYFLSQSQRLRPLGPNGQCLSFQMRSKFSKCKLRVFRLVENIENMEEEAKGMTDLLKKFRIKFKVNM